VPPLRTDNYKHLIALARGRFGQAVGDDIPEGDLYFLKDGGKTGNQQDLMRPFASKVKPTIIFTMRRDEESLTQRLQPVEGGVGAYQQWNASTLSAPPHRPPRRPTSSVTQAALPAT